MTSFLPFVGKKCRLWKEGCIDGKRMVQLGCMEKCKLRNICLMQKSVCWQQ